MHKIRSYTIPELISYRNKMLTRARARTRSFEDNNDNYYWTRIKEIDSVLEYNIETSIKSLGMIQLAVGNVKLVRD